MLRPLDRSSGRGRSWLTHARARRAAKPIIRRVMPVMIMLIPTSVPMSHSELEGH